MRFALRILSRIALGLLLGRGLTTSASATDPVEFQGIVSGVHPGDKTISVRRGSKDYVFKIDPARCKIVKDGASSSALESAGAGDSVVGSFVVIDAAPVVTHLYLTTKPELGVRVPDKPGFIASPYPAENAAIVKRPIDVRGYRRGSMLVDTAAGMIFLVP